MKATESKTTIPNLSDNSLVLIEDRLYRILSHEKISSGEAKMQYWLIRLNTEREIFQILKTTDVELFELIVAGRLVEAMETESPNEPTLKGLDKAKTDLKYICIKKYVNSIYPNFSILSQRGTPKEELKRLAEACKLSEKNIRRYLLRYLQSGGTYVSVVDRRFIYSKSDSFNPYSGKVKGPHRNGLPNSVENNESLFCIFEETYAAYNKKLNEYQYNSGSKYKPTLSAAYRGMLIKYFMIENENGVQILAPENERPSYFRFSSWVKKVKYHGGTITQNAVSAQDRRNNNRLLVGTSDYGVFNLMEMVEIDENECSVSLVSGNPETPNQAIGNAVVYLATDVLSRRIVGASVAFVNNSYEGFLDLMDSMMMSDSENAKIFGVQYNESQPVFPGCRLPQEIRVDHGSEYVSHAINSNLAGGDGSALLAGLPIGINLTPVGMGSMKGIVERFFGTLHRNIQNALKSGCGYVTGTHTARHHLNAVLTIKDFRTIVYETIRYYNNSVIVNYPLTPKIKAAVQTVTPNALWNYFSKERLCGYDVSKEKNRIDARYGLMKNDKIFCVSKKQISYRDSLYWDIGEDIDLLYKALQCGEGREKIDIRYDPRSVDAVYRKDSRTGKIFRYHLAEKRSDMKCFLGMRWPVVDKWISENNSSRYEAGLQKQEDLLNLEKKTNDIAMQAVKSKESAKNSTKNRRIYRETEKAALSNFDTKNKNEIFFGELLDYTYETRHISEIAETDIVEPIEPITDEIIPSIDVNDISALAAAYGIPSGG